MTEKELFCKVICAAMFPEVHPMPDVPREQFPILYEILQSHALTLLPDKLLQAAEMPEVLRTQWQKALYVQKLRFGQYLLQQDGVLRLFSQAGIPCVVLKGTVSAFRYPEPAYRAMGDMDLLVRPSDQEKAVGLLKANGFQEYGYRDDVEQGFLKDGVLVELHIGICENERINAFLLNHFDEAESKALYGFPFPCMPELCNGLILLEHMHRHFRDTLGFRQVVDWMMYVDAGLDDDAWNGAMRSLFAQCGLERFAIVVTAMCQRYFGLRTAGITWPAAADEALCEELYEHIYAMGNFGRRLKARGKTAASVLRDRSLLEVLMDLQKVGLDNWRLCHTHPWLKPFAWLYQALLYLYRIVTEGYNMSPQLVKEERRRVAKTLELMKKLELSLMSDEGRAFP